MRDESSAETAAAIQILAREIINEVNAPVPVDLPARIAAGLEETISDLLYRERERCVAICKRRVVLWSNSTMSSSPLGREESRARTNEATLFVGRAVRATSRRPWLIDPAQPSLADRSIGSTRFCISSKRHPLSPSPDTARQTRQRRGFDSPPGSRTKRSSIRCYIPVANKLEWRWIGYISPGDQACPQTGPLGA